MKRAKITGKRKIELLDVPPPTPGPGQVKVRVHASGVCGSDVLEYLYPGEFSQCLGHEYAGTVAEAGPGAEGFRVGDRVVAHEYSGQGFSEYTIVRAGELLPLPEELSFEEGALLEPMVVVLCGLRHCRFRVGDTCFVAGCGPIGLLGVQMMRAFGARRIIASEPNGHRRAKALEFGADRVIDLTTEPVEEIVLSVAGGKVDFSLDCAGTGDSILTCSRVTRRNHVVCILGLTPGPLDVSSYDLFRQMVRFHSALPADRRLFNVAMRLILDRKVEPTRLVSHRYPLSSVAEAFDLAARPDTDALKIMVQADAS